MKILIDADACPVTNIVKKVAKEKQIPLLIFCDTSHILNTNYGEVITIGKGADAVDFALINRSKKGDIIVTQDYGVAAMALGKGTHPIHQSGRWYTNENIDQMLMERHIAKEIRRSSKKGHLKGAKKRVEDDNESFETSLLRLIQHVSEI